MIKLKQILLLTVLSIGMVAYAQGPNNTGTYYKPADGFTGKTLKTKLYQIVGKLHTTEYNGLWETYKTADVRPDGKLWDMYSKSTSYEIGGSMQGHASSSEGGGYNREHSMPKSWFHKQKPMHNDAFHVVPADTYVNSVRNNFPYGENKGEMFTGKGNFGKKGKCTTPGYSGTVFEPADEYKGDFARIYFYMATAYKAAIAGWTSPVMSGNEYRPYVKWQMDMLMRWAKEDPVSQKEILRNEAVAKVQGNRNPFIDYPGLEEYVWGSKVDEKFSYDNYVSPTPANPNDVGGVYPGYNGEDPEDPQDPNQSDDKYTFKKITQDSELQTGTDYLIVCEAENTALGKADGTKTGKFYAPAKVEIKNFTITTTVDGKNTPHRIKISGAEGAYALFDIGTGVYLVSKTNKNSLEGIENESPTWTIAFTEEGNADIKSTLSEKRSIFYNAQMQRFSVYNSTTQKPVQLYKFDKVETGITYVTTTMHPAAAGVYTIYGQKVSDDPNTTNLSKGVYIVNGKKVLVK